MELNDLKSEYEKLEKKYKLPSFKEINESFEIDRIDRESDILLRVVRKMMMEKILNSLGFVEMLMNPMNAPRMYHAYIKSMTPEEKKIIDKLYNDMSELSIASLECEIDYDENEEADLIKEVYNTWIGLRKDFKKVFEKIRKPSKEVKRDRDYFG
jgi:DNA replication initiation complex subunit (GINS family)